MAHVLPTCMVSLESIASGSIPAGSSCEGGIEGQRSIPSHEAITTCCSDTRRSSSGDPSSVKQGRASRARSSGDFAGKLSQPFPTIQTEVRA